MSFVCNTILAMEIAIPSTVRVRNDRQLNLASFEVQKAAHFPFLMSLLHWFSGLSVTLLVGASDYLDTVQVSGIRVVISNQNEALFPDLFGFNVATGFHAAAALKKVRSLLLLAPNQLIIWSQCYRAATVQWRRTTNHA